MTGTDAALNRASDAIMGAEAEANREELLAGEAEPPRTDFTVRPSRIPPTGYLGTDPTQLVESVRQFRKMLGQG